MDPSNTELPTLLKIVFDDLTTKDEIIDYMNTLGKSYVLKLVESLIKEFKSVRKSIVNGQKTLNGHGEIMERLEGTIVRFIHHDINVRILSLIILYDDKLKILNIFHKEWEQWTQVDYTTDEDLHSLLCLESLDDI